MLLENRSGSMSRNLELEVRAAETLIHGISGDRLRSQLRQRHRHRAGDFTSEPRVAVQVLRAICREMADARRWWNAIDRAIGQLLLEKSRRVVIALSDGVDEPLDCSGTPSR